MDGSGDRLLQDDVFVRGGYEVPGAHQSIHIFAFRDASQSTRSGNINSQNAIYVGDLEAAVDDFDISEFFDLQNAALDPDDAHPSPSEPQLTTATTTNTLRSTGSEDILRSPSGDPTQCSRHVMLDGSGGGRESNIAKTTSTLLSPLWHWPIDHITIQIQPRPNNAFITVPNDRDAQLSWNMKRKASQEDITGNPCFNPNVGPGSTKKRKKLTAEQLESARSIRAQGGACLRCYVQKQKCSEGRPCGGCQKLFNKAYGSKTLQWTACISSNLPDINIFALGIVTSRSFMPTTN
ncbi:hypothetical protein BU26DRAFT_500349 [Trematosphaeria pertusa]|uniref:Zn(2)-C6 fungal-type domain-containing protein n=1 Tax=Trematosphaeria pertusa TaxID=390896 RepID=A0A6A6IYD8_9PLEO|nr:uncharacterized protein BU26DRAFT_500349 [Trematosphaeria pertusa]KAF2254630.1 hypothetical protein BU26DRAFT_500349 [Trematosphaeria pertusa]